LDSSALDVGFLDHRGQRLLRHASRLEEAREVAPAAQLGDAQLDRSSPCLPVAVAISVSLIGSPGAALAGGRAAHRFRLQRHQAFGGEANHLAQECRVGSLLQQLAKGDLVVGHRGGDPWVRVVLATQPYPALPR
jgi:hypothetical protein